MIYSSNTEALQMSLRSVSTERFFYYTNLIAQMPQTSDAKTEMIEECRQYYQNDPTEMKIIDKFVDEYYQQRSGTAIWWYSQDSFLYRRLNEACRTEDIDLIYVFRNFISDLLQQLQELHSQFYEDIWGIPITVYRGQKMSINELNHLRKNIGKLFSTNTFLSASVDLDVALVFAGIDNQCPPLESVLFKYNIDTSIETKRPYADITLISSKPSEREIMFCMGTIFQIESIEHITMDQENNKHTYWCIELKLVNENEDQLLASKLKEFEQRNQTAPLLLILGNLAKERSRISNDFCKAERYFRLHLEEVLNANDEMDYKSRTRAYRNLAAICIAKGDYAAGIEYHENVIKIILQLPLSLWNNEDNQIITETTSAYVSIAKTYQWKTIDYDSAIKTYQQLLEFQQKEENPCLICITNTINAIGDIHTKQVRWSAALECYRKAYALNSDDSGFNRDRLDDAEEKILTIQSRYPEILFLLLFFTWCYCYSFDIFDIDDMILWNLMPLSLIRLINYYFIQHATKKVSNKKLLHLRRFDALMNKVQKKFTNTLLREQKQRFFSRLHMIIPPFTSFLTEQSPLFSNKNILNKRTYFVIVATVLLAAYLPIIFVLITRIVMILFVIIWLSDLNSVQCSILIILYYYCQKQLLLLLSTYIVLLESEFQLVARQKRRIPAVSFTYCLKHFSRSKV
jgi:tetratricopeptide (TPR) repeat protein